MSYILHIETATPVCSVAVSDNEELIFYKEELEGPSHANILGSYVKSALDYCREKSIKLDAVAVSAGPGSYTGLRIGVSEAKGICYGLNIPLIAIETLEIMAFSVKQLNKDTDENTLFCPMLDARRMEVYDALFDQKLCKVRNTSADIIDDSSFQSELEHHKIVFFGNGANKCKNSIQSPNAIFLDNIYPLAKNMINLAYQAFLDKKFVDVAYYEPFYLKEFVGTIPKNKVLQ